MDASRSGVLLSVNLAARTLPTPHDTGRTGIGKHPVSWPVPVSDPGLKRPGHPRPNGLAGDIVCTTEHHGGTTQGLDLTGTLVGERWRIGGTVVLQATSPRIPCATFAHRMSEPKWVKRFTARGATGTYLRVVVPGEIKAGDRIEVIRRPRHTVTIGRSFRALTTQAELLPGLLQAGDDLPPEERAAVLRRTG